MIYELIPPLRPASRAPNFLVVVCMVFCALALPGCSTQGQGRAARGDMITYSDETPARKLAKIRFELASGYYANGQISIALDELKQSINADPGLFEAHNLRGLIYMQLNDPKMAEDGFRRALAVNPQAATVQHNFAWLLCQQGRMSESYKFFQTAIATPNYSERPKTWMMFGICQSKAGSYPEAVQSLTRAHELDPANPVVIYNLALTLTMSGEWDKAKEYIRRVNNGEFANAESLWLGIKIERFLGNKTAVSQLGAQLLKRFAQSKESTWYQRGAFDE